MNCLERKLSKIVFIDTMSVAAASSSYQKLCFSYLTLEILENGDFPPDFKNCLKRLMS